MVDNFLVLVEENSENVPIDLHQELVAFPEPSVFSWNKDGQPLRTCTDQHLLLTCSTPTSPLMLSGELILETIQ